MSRQMDAPFFTALHFYTHPSKGNNTYAMLSNKTTGILPTVNLLRILCIFLDDECECATVAIKFWH